MKSALAGLQLSNPVLAAPMAGGPTTPALVIAAARAESLGLLAAGYKSPELLAEQIEQVRASTATFGVNLFAPNPVPVDRTAFRRYAAAIQAEAAAYGIDVMTAEPVEDDDQWHSKIDLLLASPVPLVSFTFGIPGHVTIKALQRVGSLVIQTVTSPAEAQLAQDAGADVLAVQATAAGGHSGTLTPQTRPDAVRLLDLVAGVRAATKLPIIAAGGLSIPADVTAALQAGADAVMVGTVLLRAPESGASDVHKAAVASNRGPTVITQAFTGRPARALPNAFIRRHDAAAPLGYPAIHHLTSGLRRASAAAGDPELVNLWAGTGYRNATNEPAEAILTRLGRTT